MVSIPSITSSTGDAMSHRFYPLGVKRGPLRKKNNNLGTQWPKRTSPLFAGNDNKTQQRPCDRPQIPPCNLAPRQRHMKEADVPLLFFGGGGEAAVLINNLSHTTTNPRVNVGNTSLFPSLSFYHKHINICLTRVLRCAARPPGPHQAAGAHKGHAEMWRGRPRSHRPKCEERVCVRTATRSFSWRISACAEGLRPRSQSQTPVKTVSWRCTRQT